MVLENKFPPDIRVTKEVRSLIEANHVVHLLSMRRTEDKKYEKINGLHVHRLVPFTKNIFSPSKIINFLSNIPHLKISWYKSMNDLIRKQNIKVVHIHDLPLVKTGIAAARNNGIKIIADLHENYPAAVDTMNFNLPMKIINYLSFWKRHERRILNNCDRIVVVVPEAKERLFKLGIEKNKIYVVSNTEDVSMFTSNKIDQQLASKYKNDFVVSYIGGFGSHRGIDTAIKSIPKLKNEIPNIRLLLVGETPRDKKFRKISNDLKVNNYVDFIGWQNANLVPSYIELSSICLVPHHKNPHTNSTIPHKLFQYMLLKKPVIVSDCKPLKRVVNELKSGIVFKSGSADSLADAIRAIYNTPDSYGENGYSGVIRKYNWQHDGSVLQNIYSEIENNTKN